MAHRPPVATRHNPWLVAVVLALAGLLVRYALTPYLGPYLPFVGSFPAILVSAWYGGFWPGMLTTVLSMLLTTLVVPGELPDEAPSHALRIALLLPCGALICLLAEHLHRNRHEANRRLDAMMRLARPSQRLQAALELSALSAADVDRDLRYVWVRKPPLGLAEGDMLGKTAEEFFEPELAAALTAARRQILETGKACRIELRLRRDDRVEWVDWIGGPLRDPDGTIIGVTNLAIDITDRKRSELQLRRRGDAQRLLVELNDVSRDGNGVAEIEAGIVRRVARHFGADRCAFAEISPEDGTAEVTRDHANGLPSVVGRHRLAPPDSELMRRLAAGETIALPGGSEPLPAEAWMDPDARPAETGSLLCVPVVHEDRLIGALSLRLRGRREWSEEDIELGRDIAGRAWSGITRARAQLQLRESRDVLALAMRGGRMGAWSREYRSDRGWWSRELEEIYGLEKDGFKGTREDFLALLHPDDRDKVRDALETAVATGSDYVVEYRFRHSSGEWRWMEGRGRHFYHPDGRPHITYGLGIDITERKRSEEERRRLNAELAESLRRKDEFLATLAHELRNPLAPIVTALEVLRLKSPEDEQMRWSRDVIDRQVRHMTRLVDDLLDVARIATGKAQLRTERIELASVVNHAVEASRNVIDAGRHELSIELPAEPLLVEADPTRLSQVLANLLSNAAKYTPHGGRIGLRVRADGAEAVMEVTDNGIGIPQPELERIFSMFAQVTPAIDRSQGGLGIGLALSRGLVELHGGRIDATSSGPGKGSTFTVRLPLGVAPAVKHAPLPAAAAQPAQGTAARRILVVDDNIDAAESLAMLLQLDGHETALAHDGQRALELARSFAPQVILLDIGLPLMNGYEVARRLRAQPWGRGIALIAVTGWGQEQDRQQAQAAGFDHHLTKPLDPSRLAALLDAVQPRQPQSGEAVTR
ncbi:MAG: PAS domain-containing protein [Burkholderiaceae bacterium]|nr:PAS domain-containing protein [Burkholderiaceae bacterium]